MYLESLPGEKKIAGHVVVAFSDFVYEGDTFVAESSFKPYTERMI